jgi:hypothetical protein
MGSQLSPETEAALRKLAREIGRARSLGEDAQEELYGHLEDKTLGYLSGEDGITEADAVLLTREHFGDPGAFPEAVAQAQLPFRSSVSLPRRLAAVAVLTLTLGVAVSVLKLLVAMCLDTGSALVFFGSAGRASIFLFEAVSLGAIFMLLRRWRTLERRGSRVWYQNCAGSVFTFAVGALILLKWCIPGVRADDAAFSAGHEQFLYSLARTQHPIIYVYLYIAVDWALNLIAPMLWIWWGEQRTKRTRAIMLSAAIWVGFNTAAFVPSIVIGAPMYLLGETAARFGMHEVIPLDSIKRAFGLTPEAHVATLIAAMGYFAVALAVIAGIATVIYVLLGRGVHTLRKLRSIEVHWRPAAR